MGILRIKNFERFQHYKDRNPPWVKLYRDLWRDRQFFRLPESAKLLFIGLLTVASITDNEIPDDVEWIAAELAFDATTLDLSPLIEAGFLIGDGVAAPKRASWPSRYIPDAVKQQVIDRDRVCRVCSSTENLEIDHVIPVSKLPSDWKPTADGLQLLCRRCNRSKRARLSAEQVATQTNLSAYPSRASVSVSNSVSVSSSEGESEGEAKNLEFALKRSIRDIAQKQFDDEFWPDYPRKDGKQEALRAWLKLEPGERDAALIDVPQRVAANWADRELSKIPHASTYLNQKRWTDELQRSAGVRAGPAKREDGLELGGGAMESLVRRAGLLKNDLRRDVHTPDFGQGQLVQTANRRRDGDGLATPVERPFPRRL